MMAGIENLGAAGEAVAVLELCGYAHAPHRPHQALWFFKPEGSGLSTRTHHLHLTQVGSDLWRERLGFRDALRADPQLLREYQDLKRLLAQEHLDMASYTKGKRALVSSVLATVGVQLGGTDR